MGAHRGDPLARSATPLHERRVLLRSTWYRAGRRRQGTQLPKRTSIDPSPTFRTRPAHERDDYRQLRVGARRSFSFSGGSTCAVSRAVRAGLRWLNITTVIRIPIEATRRIRHKQTRLRSGAQPRPDSGWSGHPFSRPQATGLDAIAGGQHNCESPAAAVEARRRRATILRTNPLNNPP